MERTKRKSDIDNAQFDDLQQKHQTVYGDLQQYKKIVLEMQNMHREDILMQFMEQDQKINKIKNIVKKVKETHEYLLLEVNDNAARMDKLELRCNQAEKFIKELQDEKLDIKIFDEKLDQVDSIVDTMGKRMAYNEYENV